MLGSIRTQMTFVERWFASVHLPTFADAFALVERIDGQW